MTHFTLAPKLNVVPRPTKRAKAPSIQAALEELFVLLEDYGPVWYTEKHHDRAIRALRRGGLKKRIASYCQPDAAAKNRLRKCG
jgi:hypothetical protein